MTSFYLYQYDFKRPHWVSVVEWINHNGCYTSAAQPATGLDDRAFILSAVIEARRSRRGRPRRCRQLKRVAGLVNWGDDLLNWGVWRWYWGGVLLHPWNWSSNWVEDFSNHGKGLVKWSNQSVNWESKHCFAWGIDQETQKGAICKTGGADFRGNKPGFWNRRHISFTKENRSFPIDWRVQVTEVMCLWIQGPEPCLQVLSTEVILQV